MKSKKLVAVCLAAALQLGMIFGFAAYFKARRYEYRDAGTKVLLSVSGFDLRNEDEMRLYFYVDVWNGSNYCELTPKENGEYRITTTDTEPTGGSLWYIPDEDAADSTYILSEKPKTRSVYIFAAREDESPGAVYDAAEDSVTIKYATALATAYVYENRLYVDSVTVDGKPLETAIADASTAPAPRP